MKRTLAGAGLAIVLAVSLAGCGGVATPEWTYATSVPAPTPGTAIVGGGAGSAASPAPSPAPAGPTAAPHDMSGTAGATAAAKPVADPGAPDYVLYDPNAPTVLSGTVHDIDLPMIETDMTVAPGFVVHAWTFGGTVPGPTIRVHLGDTVRVHLRNDGKMPHSIDFHASQTAMDHQMISINPGQTFTYTFKADYAGVWMYHCGTAPTLHHIANGMFGMVIVEPRGGLPGVDREFAFVQSEWYLGAQAQPVDYMKASAAAPSPDFVVFNGVASQYKDHPIAVKANDRIRVFVLDAGPNIDSSFHVVGTIFDTVHKEGVSLLKGNAEGWGSQAVDLSPAQGAIVEFQIPENGSYAFVTHAFNFVGLGAIGVFKAGGGPDVTH